MESTVDFLAAKHAEILRNKYRGEHCEALALKVAQRLIAEGETPRIELVYEERTVEGRTVIVEQHPQTLQGECEPWLGHYVCCTAKQAFDPLLGRPVRREDYTTELFGEAIAMEVSTPSDRVQAEIDRMLW